MHYILCCIKDTAVGSFNRPFCVRARGEAMRIFTDEVNRQDPQNPLFLHPKDFELWIVGSFDDATGVVMSSDHDVIAIGVDVRMTE